MINQININNDSNQAESVNTKHVFNDLIEENNKEIQHPELNFIYDIPVSLTVELGRTKIPIKNLLKLTQGSVIELDGLAGQPLGILINDRLIANGEVFVVNNKYGIRLTEIISPTDRIQKLNK